MNVRVLFLVIDRFVQETSHRNVMKINLNALLVFALKENYFAIIDEIVLMALTRKIASV